MQIKIGFYHSFFILTFKLININLTFNLINRNPEIHLISIKYRIISLSNYFFIKIIQNHSHFFQPNPFFLISNNKLSKTIPIFFNPILFLISNRLTFQPNHISLFQIGLHLNPTLFLYFK